MPQFERYIGIDYSGAKTPVSCLPGLSVYEADSVTSPHEVSPPGSRKRWTRRGIAVWLNEQLSGGKTTLVGIDHGFSFPIQYFDKHRLARDWPAFLDDFQAHWPADGDHVTVDSIRNGQWGNFAKRTGDKTWLRLTEQWTATAKSVFLFDVQGQVAKSTHAGLPWLQYLRARHPRHLHFWPFDGWEIPTGHSALAEIYPSLWMKRLPKEGRDADQQAAYASAAWMRRADFDGSLSRFFNPPLEADERIIAKVEGWILGVT